jgi:hypothetical protein
MPLQLGKSFDRNYNIRMPFLSGFYNIGMFFSKKSTFLLFSVDQDFSTTEIGGTKINMFKNLEGSKFCETFINLHNYRKETLDIQNQFKEIKPEFFQDISFLTNETITLAKIEIDDRILYDTLNIYAFTMNAYINEFIFLITERHNIVKRLRKKVVRTSGLQISTTSALKMLDEYNEEYRKARRHYQIVDRSDQIIKLD